MRLRAIVAAAVLVLTALYAAGQTADELIAKNIAARGGLEKLKAVQTMRLTGTMKVGDDAMPSILELKRPNKSRWQFSFEGQTAIQAFDGRSGWMLMPFAGMTEPQAMSPEEKQEAEQQADLDGPLVDYKAKGSAIELVGRDPGLRPEDWKLRVTLKTGEVRYIYLDPSTHLQTMTVMTKKIEGTEVVVISTIGDYRDVGGLILPHSFSASTKDGAETQSLVFDKIELNVPIDDTRFGKPKGQQRVPAPAGPPVDPVVG
jgi:outer membrane lipoprotein-sorting protein